MPTFEAAFSHYLGRNKPAWAPRFSYNASEAIAMIHQAGGKAVLAHPGMLSSDIRVIAPLVQELARYGLDGVEVYYPSHNKQFRRKLVQLTPKGKQLANRMFRDIVNFESEALKKIEDVDIHRLQSFLTRYADALALTFAMPVMRKAQTIPGMPAGARNQTAADYNPMARWLD